MNGLIEFPTGLSSLILLTRSPPLSHTHNFPLNSGEKTYQVREFYLCIAFFMLAEDGVIIASQFDCFGMILQVKNLMGIFFFLFNQKGMFEHKSMEINSQIMLFLFRDRQYVFTFIKCRWFLWLSFYFLSSNQNSRCNDSMWHFLLFKRDQTSVLWCLLRVFLSCSLSFTGNVYLTCGICCK